MVHVMHTDQDGLIRQRRADVLRIHQPFAIHFDAGAGEPLALQELDRMDDRKRCSVALITMWLPLALARQGRAFHRQVCRFRRAGRKNDFPRRGGIDQRGDFRAGLAPAVASRARRPW